MRDNQMDETDKKIAKILIHDARIPFSKIAEELGKIKGITKVNTLISRTVLKRTYTWLE